MKKLLFPMILFTVLGLAVIMRINQLEGTQVSKREGIEQIQIREGFPVKSIQVEQRQFDVWQEVPAKVRGNKEAYLTTSNPARVAVIRYKVGDFVKADTPVISLDENDPKSMAKVKLLNNVYQDAVKDYERYNALYKAGGISKDVLDKMYLKLRTAKTNLDSAKSTVHLTSPISGILLALYTRVGENAKPGKTLAVVSAVEKLRLVASVSDRDIGLFRKGQAVEVGLENGAKLTGAVDRVSLGANPKTSLFDIEMVVRNEGNALRVGMFTIAQVKVFSSDKATVIPAQAILRDVNGNPYVYQIKEGHAVKKEFSIKHISDSSVAVEGLDPGLPLVIEGQEQLRKGVKVLQVGKVGS